MKARKMKKKKKPCTQQKSNHRPLDHEACDQPQSNNRCPSTQQGLNLKIRLKCTLRLKFFDKLSMIFRNRNNENNKKSHRRIKLLLKIVGTSFLSKLTNFGSCVPNLKVWIFHPERAGFEPTTHSQANLGNNFNHFR